MKGNTKKLAVFMIITVIALFILAACATTSPPASQAIQGRYVGGGVSTCLFAVCGFGADKVPNVPTGPSGGWGTGAWSLSNNSHSMVMTLEPDGTGTVSESILAVVLNNTSPKIPWPSITSGSKDTHKITYTVAPDGTFTLKDVPGSFKVEPASGPPYVLTGFINIGHISPDGKIITMFDTGAPKTFVPPLYVCPVPTEPKSEAGMACTATFILFKQHDKEHP
jgi:hypothetical protein